MELILVKLWKIVKTLGGPAQISYLSDSASNRAGQPEVKSIEEDSIVKVETQTKHSLTQMVIVDLALYHTFLAMIALTIAEVEPDARETL